MTHNRPVPVDTIPERDMLKIEVQLFAAAAQRAGTRQLTVSAAHALSLEELCGRLVQLCPALQPLAKTSRWAVDCEFIESSYLINSDISIAMIPPVSGG